MPVIVISDQQFRLCIREAAGLFERQALSLETTLDAADDRSIFLSTLPATDRDRRIALGVVAASTIFFAATLPYLSPAAAADPAFVASYQSALAINDLITTILLLSQFSLLRSRALLVLASGYLFTAVAAIGFIPPATHV